MIVLNRVTIPNNTSAVNGFEGNLYSRYKKPITTLTVFNLI